MGLVKVSSLALTVDAVSEALFYGQKPAPSERDGAAKFIAARQGQPGSYAGLFAPLGCEPNRGFQVLTGETIASVAGSIHILGQESYRALLQLGSRAREVKNALERAPQAMGERLRGADSRGPGMYCCGICSVAVWRCLQAGGYGGLPGYVEHGIARLATLRDGKGRWRIFPFWYTLAALVEAEGKPARSEMRYAAPVLERALRRAPRSDVHARRRHALAERVLARC